MSRRPACWGKWAQVSAWTLGAALVVLYCAARAWAEHSREQGVAAFRAPHPNRSVRSAASVLDSEAPEGLLIIPSLHLELPIYAGATEVNLHRGAAHIEGTSGLTQGGNVGLAGHRDSFFRKLKDLRLGHEVDIEVDGRVQRYRIVEIRVVSPLERAVLAATHVPTITLVTCYPFYVVGHAPERYIVRAERIS